MLKFILQSNSQINKDHSWHRFREKIIKKNIMYPDPKEKPEKQDAPVKPEKDIPVKPDIDPDPTKQDDPKKNDPTRIDEPSKVDPTRIDDPPPNK
jgi:hypothetical protein